MFHGRIRAAAIALSLSTLAIAATGCSSIGSNSGGQSTENADGPLSVTLLVPWKGLPYFNGINCGALAAAKDLGGDISVDYQGKTGGADASVQAPLAQSIVASHPDGWIFSPASPSALNPIVKQAVDSGITTVTVDQALDEELALAQYYANGKQGGQLGADEMAKLLGDTASGEILVLDNTTGLPVTNLRAEGFIEAMKAYPQFTVLPTQYYQSDQNKAASIVSSVLASNPNLVGVFFVDEVASTGGVSALANAGSVSDNIRTVAYDAADSVGIEQLRSGQIDAAIAQPAYAQGYDALTRIVNQIRTGKDSGEFDNPLDNVLITKENMDDPDIVKAMYPTEESGCS